MKFRHKFLRRILLLLANKNKILKLLLIPIEKELLKFAHEGYLHEIGWFFSWHSKKPQDQNQSPLPWVTYSYIQFIKPLLNSTLEIFEYGSGASTAFYCTHCLSVDSVEHDQLWYAQVIKEQPSNANVIYRELIYGGEYSKTVYQIDKKFDIIIIDGRDRANCCFEAVNGIKSDGVIVLDDSERIEYIKGIEFLKSSGYRNLDFWGISPGLFYNKCTTIFYKSNNILKI